MSADAMGPVTFRPVTPDDYAMLMEWMHRPHWREWWGDPDDEIGFVRDMVEGRDPTCRPFLFSVGGRPVGYIQVWQVGPHQVPAWTADHPWLLALPADAVGLDLAVADPADLSRGLGSTVLRRFVEGLLAEGHRTIVIDPDPLNGRAVAAYRKAGFRPVPELEGRTEGVLIMRFEEGRAA